VSSFDVPSSVVLEENHVVGGGFDPQDGAEPVVHFDRALTKSMVDAGAFDAGGKLICRFPGDLRPHLPAKEGGDLFGLDAERPARG
jgi:hypothetical protein